MTDKKNRRKRFSGSSKDAFKIIEHLNDLIPPIEQALNIEIAPKPNTNIMNIYSEQLKNLTLIRKHFLSSQNAIDFQLAMAKQDPLNKYALKFDWESITNLLESEDYQEVLKKKNGIAMLLCILAHDIKIIQDAEWKNRLEEKLSEAKNAITLATEMLTQPLIKRRSDGYSAGISKKTAIKKEKIIQEVKSLPAHIGPRDTASYLANKHKCSQAYVRKVLKNLKNSTEK